MSKKGFLLVLLILFIITDIGVYKAMVTAFFTPEETYTASSGLEDEELIDELVADELSREEQEKSMPNEIEEITQESGESSDNRQLKRKSLFDCVELINDWSYFAKRCSVEDNVGNFHESTNLFRPQTNANWTIDGYRSEEELDEDNTIVIILDGEFNTLEIPEIFLSRECKDWTGSTHLEFYDNATGNYLGETPAIGKGDRPIISFSIDVTDIQDLKIKKVGYCHIGIDEAWVY